MRTVPLLLAALCAVAMTMLVPASCRAPLPPHQFRVAEAAPLVTRVCDRHDAYVGADPLLSNEKRAEALGQSQILRALVAGEGIGSTITFEFRAQPVFDRHDSYVRSDAALGIKAPSFLRTTELLRDEYFEHPGLP